MKAAIRPEGLSEASRSVWAELTKLHEFEPHELVTFERALRWFDRSDRSLVDADATDDGREQARLMKQAVDSSNCGLRYWRVLKFTDGTATRRPGRRPAITGARPANSRKLVDPMPIKRDTSTEISPALLYYLLIGEFASARVHGWVDLATTRDEDLDRYVQAVWAEHGEALKQLAAAAGFTPAAATGETPRGPAADAWRKAFLEEHQY